MNGSPESASNDGLPGGSRVLIAGLNWIGDGVMSMPAIQAFRRRHPDIELHVLLKPALHPLWKLHAAPDRLINLEESPLGTFRTAARLRAERYARAYLLPNSFRSALIPFLAGIPERVGVSGHGRARLLTSVVRWAPDPVKRHQAWEYLRLMSPADMDKELEPPRVSVPPPAFLAMSRMIKRLKKLYSV